VAGYKKAENVRTVVDHHQLPVSVLFDNPVFSGKLRLATVRALGTSLPLEGDAPLSGQGSLKLVRQYTEAFYVINHIINGLLQLQLQPEMEPGLRVTGSPVQRFWPGLVGSLVNVSDPVFDPVLSFNMHVYRGVVYNIQSNIISAN